jgi:hypothetical protein
MATDSLLDIRCSGRLLEHSLNASFVQVMAAYRF